MALSTPPAGTALGSSTYPHRLYHTGMTEVRYAHPDGDNAKDGLTWGTAKEDVVSAYDALPSSGGTIYIGDNTYWDSTNTDRGLWLLGSEDPAYNGGSPTGGWRVRKRCAFIGVGNSHAANSHLGPQSIVFGGSTSDRTKPAIWIAGTGGPLYFENIHTQYHAVSWRLGVKSDLSGSLDSSGITMRGCSQALDLVAGNGPGVELGYMYWWFMEHCTLSGNSTAYTLTAATRVGAVATFTTSITHSIAVGDTVYVTGVTPSGYNGTWTVSAVAATTFTATLTADPGGSGTVFGTAEPVKNYRRGAVAHYTDQYAASQTPSGLLHFENCNFNSGGFYYKPTNQTSSGEIVMRNITHEGDFSGPEPPTFFLRTATYGDAAIATSCIDNFIQNVEVADAEGTAYAVEVEGVTTDPHAVVVINAPSNGNVTEIGVTTRNQSGIANGTFIGGHVGHNRAFSPVAVRFANLASHTLSGGDWTTGVTAPDGTTNASSLTGSQEETLYTAGTAAQPGDWIIAGTWKRYSTLSATNDADWPIVTIGSGTFEGGSSFFVVDRPDKITDLGWVWLAEGQKVLTAGDQITYTARCHTDNTVAYFAPILLHIPAASALADEEMKELVRHLQTYPSTAAVGDVVTLAGQNLHSTGALEIDGALNHDGTTVGFYGVTPATRPTAYTQTYATADKTQANLTVGADLGAFTDPPSAAEMAALRTFVNALKADLIDVKQITNSIIDDLQTLGILQ